MNPQTRHKIIRNHQNNEQHSLHSPQHYQKHLQKQPSDRKELRKIHKKQTNKAQTRVHQLSSKQSLFQSLQDLTLAKIGKQKKHRMRRKENKNIVTQQKNEDSTASRDFRQYFKNYDHPNGEYFGSRVTSLDNKQISTHSKQSKKKKMKSQKGTASLQKFIRQYRRLSSQHKSESESLKSEISDQQLRRLKKMQLIDKMMIMQDIVSIQQRRLRLKKVRSDFRI